MPATPSYLPHGQSAIVWTDAAHEAEGMRLMLAMGDAIEPKAVGGPGSASLRPDQATVVPLGLRGGDDLRAMILAHKPRWVLAMTNEDVHPSELPMVDGHPVTLLTREPLAVSEMPKKNQSSAHVVLAGSFLDTPGMVEAQAHAVGLGGLAVVNVVSTGAQASLLARLLDAWEAALKFAPLPESVHAALTGPVGQSPSTLEGMTGRLTAHGLVRGEGSISLLCADSGPERRALTLVTDCGDLYATPAVDGSQPSRSEAILAQWRQLMMQDEPPLPASPEAWACCMACLLSIRTRSEENPRRLLSMDAMLFS